MSYQNEETLVVKDEQPQQKSFAKTMLAIMAVSFLALACVAFYTNGAGESMASAISFRASVGRMNRKALSTVVTFGADAFKPYSYLQGKFLSAKYKTIGHGLDSKGQVTKTRPFFSVDIQFFKGVSKTQYSKDGTLNEKFLWGTFQGLDTQGNAVFGDGVYCSALSSPSYGVLEILCGNNYAVSGVYMSNPCAMKITVTHPRQCGAQAVSTLTPLGKDDKGSIAKGSWGENLIAH
jgi:hypothetical protein